MHGPTHRHALAQPPVAARKPHKSTWHGSELVDDYAWLRADNWQEVMRNPAVLEYWLSEILEPSVFDDSSLSGILFDDTRCCRGLMSPSAAEACRSRRAARRRP